jgi:RNA polymerase sigma factor (sigma-70 family)
VAGGGEQRRRRGSDVARRRVLSESPSDEALLAGLAAGQTAAAATFVRRYQARVYGLAITIVRDPGLAEDVAQETFVRAWRSAGTYDPRRGRVAAWLLTIARNAAIDAMRVRRPEPLDPEIVAGMLHEDEGAPPPDELRAALAELPEPQRRALFLAAYAGRTAREIGAIEHAPEGTIKTRIRAAMLKLRGALEANRGL